MLLNIKVAFTISLAHFEGSFRVHRRKMRFGFTLPELLVLFGILLILFSLLMPAVGSARAAARRMYCAKQTKELALANTLHHDTFKALPAGTELSQSNRPWQGWFAKMLPYLDLHSVYLEIETAYDRTRLPFYSEFHLHIATPIHAFACPEDSRNSMNHFVLRHGFRVALTGFQGNAGTNSDARDGVLYGGSHIRFADITDGLSQTLLFGERPASAGMDYGWWYAGVGTGSGGLDHTLGTAETRVSSYGNCPRSRLPYKFQSGNLRDECDASHFWSMHPGGGHFARCDGSVAFFSYASADILIAMSTRDGGEIERE